MVTLWNAEILSSDGIQVAVLMGGPSSEHKISLASGRAVARALRDLHFSVEEIVFSTPELPPIMPTTNVVFPALHGAFGEDGTLQRILEAKGIPFVGSDSVASAIAMDKNRTRALLQDAGIHVAPGGLITPTHTAVPPGLEFPAILKPNTGGSTIGLIIVKRREDWDGAVRTALQGDTEVVAEQFIPGDEMTVGLLAGEALPIVEIIPPDGLFDYDAKYTYSKGKTTYLCPPQCVSADEQRALRSLAEKVYRVLGARDLLRVDLIRSARDGQPYVLEANSIPGFTENSLLPKAAAAANISFPVLCATLIMYAYQRAPKR